MGEPGTEKRGKHQVRPIKSRVCRVVLLDDTEFATDVDKRAVGQILIDKVCKHLDLLEIDYFGLSYIDPSTGLKMWLNTEKKISKQLKGMQWNFNFEIKFYPPDPQLLHEDLTRYQLCLQIRKDIVTGKLPCSVVTYSLLGSFTVQSELGDFDVEEFGPGVEYIRKMKFAPAQDRELLKKIADLHKTHKGQTPEEAELNFLEHAKKLAMYGVEIFDAKDGEGIDIQLGICASGILVFREKLQINKFVWPKILKMSYRRTKFYIKLRTAEFDDFQTLVGFKFLSSKHAKRMWKFCVENHSFFRNREPDSPGTRRTVLRFGSRFRYSGRTQFQARQAMQTVDRPSPYFDRNYSQHGKRATYHGKTKHQRIEDEMFKPRPPPITRDPPMFDQNDVDRKPIPEPEIRDEEDVFEHEEEPENRKSRMEKIHGIRTPLAAVMKSDHAENNNVEQTPPRARDYDDEEDDSFNKPPLEESMVRTRHSYPDGLARGGKREKHDIDSIGANTNTNKSNIINQHGEKRQHGRRGRSRSQSQGKKVYFDEESLQSASFHISRSDSELGPHKCKTSIERQFQKKSERRRPTKQVTIEYRGTPNYHGPLSSNLETERRMYEIGDGSLHNRSEISVDEGFADLDESFSSSKDKKSMKMILRYEQPAYSKVRNSENVWLSGDYFGNQENTRIPELDLSPITHKSDSDLTHSTNTSNTTHVTDAPPMLRSLSHEPQHISVKSRSKVHRDQEVSDPVMSREQKNRLYGYSSSDSSDNEMEQSFSRSFVRNSHLAGRRGRRNLSTNSRSSLEKSQEEGSLLRRNKERRDSLRNEEESEERDVFKDTEMKKGENDQRNIVQTKSEAILLEKYIIHRPSQTSSMSQEDDQYLDMMSPLSVNQTPGEMVTDHIKGTDKENELDALAIDVGIAEVCDLEENFTYANFEKGARATSSTDNILNENIDEVHSDSSCCNSNIVESADELMDSLERFDFEPCVRRPKPHRETEDAKGLADKSKTSESLGTDSKKAGSNRVQFVGIDSIDLRIPHQMDQCSDRVDSSSVNFSDDDQRRPKLQRFYTDSDGSSCTSETMSPRQAYDKVGSVQIRPSLDIPVIQVQTITETSPEEQVEKEKLSQSSTSEEEEFHPCEESSSSNIDKVNHIQEEGNSHICEDAGKDVTFRNSEPERRIEEEEDGEIELDFDNCKTSKFNDDDEILQVYSDSTLPRVLKRGAHVESDDDLDETEETNIDEPEETNIDEQEETSIDEQEETNIDEQEETNIDEQKETNIDEPEETNIDEPEETNIDDSDGDNHVEENREQMIEKKRDVSHVAPQDTSFSTSDISDAVGQSERVSALEVSFERSDIALPNSIELELFEFEPCVRKPKFSTNDDQKEETKDLHSIEDGHSTSNQVIGDEQEEGRTNIPSSLHEVSDQNSLVESELFIIKNSSEHVYLSTPICVTDYHNSLEDFVLKEPQVEPEAQNSASQEDFGLKDIVHSERGRTGPLTTENRNSTLQRDHVAHFERDTNSMASESDKTAVQKDPFATDTEEPIQSFDREDTENDEIMNPLLVNSASNSRTCNTVPTLPSGHSTLKSSFSSSFAPHGNGDSWNYLSKIKPPKFVVPKHLAKSPERPTLSSKFSPRLGRPNYPENNDDDSEMSKVHRSVHSNKDDDTANTAPSNENSSSNDSRPNYTLNVEYGDAVLLNTDEDIFSQTDLPQGITLLRDNSSVYRLGRYETRNQDRREFTNNRIEMDEPLRENKEKTMVQKDEISHLTWPQNILLETPPSKRDISEESETPTSEPGQVSNAANSSGHDLMLLPDNAEGFEGMMLRNADINLKPEDYTVFTNYSQTCEPDMDVFDGGGVGCDSVDPEVDISEEIQFADDTDGEFRLIDECPDIQTSFQPIGEDNVEDQPEWKTQNFIDRREVLMEEHRSELTFGASEDQTQSSDSQKLKDGEVKDGTKTSSNVKSSSAPQKQESSIEEMVAENIPLERHEQPKYENRDDEQPEDTTENGTADSKKPIYVKKVSWNLKDEYLGTSSESSDSFDLMREIPFVDQVIDRGLPSESSGVRYFKTNTGNADAVCVVAPTGVVAAPICESEDSDIEDFLLEGGSNESPNLAQQGQTEEKTEMKEEVTLSKKNEKSKDNETVERNIRRNTIDRNEVVPSMVYRPPLQRLSSKENSFNMYTTPEEQDLACVVSEIVLAIIILAVSIMLLIMF